MGKDITFDILAKDHASSTFKNVGHAAESGGNALNKFAGFAKKAGGALAIYEGAKMAAEAIKTVVEAAMEEQAAQAKLAIALRNTTGATAEQTAKVSEWLTKQSETYGVAKDKLMPAFQRLAESTHSVTKAQKELMLAQNVSAGTGKDLSTVSLALMKANNGSVGGLARLGVKTKDAHGHTMKLVDILNVLAKTFKGQAAAQANTLQGQMGRLSATFHDVEVRLGNKLIPVLTKLAGWVLNSVMPAVSRLTSWLEGKLSPVVVKVGGVFTRVLVPAFQAVVKWIMSDLVPVMRHLYQEEFQGLMGAIRNVASHFHNLAPNVTLAVSIFKGLWNVIKGVLLPVLGELYRIVLPALGKALGLIIDVLGKVAQAAIWLWNKAFQPSIRFIVNAVGVLINVWAHMLDALGHVPGFGWAKDAARFMYSAAGQATNLANSIQQIPTSHTVHIDIVQTIYKAVKPAPAGAGVLLPQYGGGSPPAPVIAPPPVPTFGGGFGSNFSNVGSSGGHSGGHSGGGGGGGGGHKAGHKIGSGIAKGLTKAKSEIAAAMSSIKSVISTELTNISNLQSTKNGFLSTFKSNSIFGATLNPGEGVSSLIAMQQQQATEATQLMADVKQVAAMGLSKSLISQLQGQGTSGAATLHALAGGNASQIAQLNSLDAMTQASLQTAGLLAGNTARGGNIDADIAAAKRELAAEKRLEKVLAGMQLSGKLTAQGTDLIAVIKATNKLQGKASAGL